jgi:hypothetical protein
VRAERDLLKLDIQSVASSLSPVEIVICVSTIQHEMCGRVGGWHFHSKRGLNTCCALLHQAHLFLQLTLKMRNLSQL